MAVTVIFGGQFGSEGKGKTTLHFARIQQASAVVRVGGPNSGHTIYAPDGKKFILKQLPVAAILDNVFSVISSGNYIDLEILSKEIQETAIQPDMLLIDPYAVIITDADRQAENLGGLRSEIGSTGSGTGAALSRRVGRKQDVQFAKDVEFLRGYIKDTKAFLRDLLNAEKRVIIEGTQGFGLSLLHSDLYPFATSRDTSAAAFVSEAGISPLDVDSIVMVIRAFPIRVAGNSGPLPREISWEAVSNTAGVGKRIIEYTSVTNNVRRVAQFDAEIVCRSIQVNRPSVIVLNHVDYWGHAALNDGLSSQAASAIERIEREIGRPIDYLGLDGHKLRRREEFGLRYAQSTHSKSQFYGE